MRKVVYYSKTGKVKKFVEKVKKEIDVRLESIEEYSGGEFILVTSTQGFGEAPPEVMTFLEKNNKKMLAVASSGNKVWGLHLYARSGMIISELYKVPLIMKFENQGLKKDDVKNFVEGLRFLDDNMD